MKPQALIWSLATLQLRSVHAVCYDPSPAFPPPTYHSGNSELLEAFNRIQDTLTSVVSDPKYNASSYSVQVTSTQSTLWSTYHTAREKNSTRPGAVEVKGDSAFRIASITKTFTVLALLQLHEAGKIALDDPVSKHLPGLTGNLPWEHITIRILASQLSGIPREFPVAEDMFTNPLNPPQFGLPPARRNNPDLAHCHSYDAHFRPCDESDLYHAVKHLQPVYAPNFKSMYSNMAFEVLGLVISHVSGISYEDYIQTHILDIIDMKGSSFKTPPDDVAVLPNGNAWFWDVNEGVHNPTGGLYSTADDLSKYLRYILTHFNTLATGVNWLQPHSFALGGESYFGMPWEIFRTDKLLDSGRPVELYTKGGGEPGYLSYIIAIPEYGLGITVLVAGGDMVNGELIDALREIVSVQVVRAAEEVAVKQMGGKYEGIFGFERSLTDETEKLNSSLRLRYEENRGLEVVELVSNGTEVLKELAEQQPSLMVPEARAQLVPTLLYADEKKQKGEKWRLLIVPPKKDPRAAGIWDGFCITNVEFMMYDGLPLNEMVFYEGKDGKVEEIDLTAFKVRLKRQEKEELVVQEL